MKDETEAERMAIRDGFAAAALVGVLPLMMPLKDSELRDYSDAIANAAFVLAESMMAVRAARPLP